MSGSGGDQVGVDNEFAVPPRPWDKAGWIRSRIKEAAYTLLSWPYILAFAMTILYVVTVVKSNLHSQTGVTSMVAITAWGVAFARREWANWMATRKGP